MRKFEYMIFNWPAETWTFPDDRLNKFGQEGWELCVIIPRGKDESGCWGGMYVFKREIV